MTSDRQTAIRRALAANGGNVSAAARDLQVPRRTLRRWMETSIPEPAPTPTPLIQREVPATAKVYICTSAQNNTPAHKDALKSIDRYSEELMDRGYSVEMLVSTFTYDVGAYGERATKRGKAKDFQDVWWDSSIEPFICDDRIEIAPGLVWNGHLNIPPTHSNPTAGFDRYNGRKSNLIPHPRIELTSVASMPAEPAKLNYTTGAITGPNYIQRRAGILAQEDHAIGFAIVTVRPCGSWTVRHVEVAEDGSFQDIGPEGKGFSVSPDGVREAHVARAILWGDIHACDMPVDLWLRNWGAGGVLDTLRPTTQFFGDVLSMRTRSKHDEGNFHRTYDLHALRVEDEVAQAAKFLRESTRSWCRSVVIHSNHDRHFDQWLNYADFRKDPINAAYFCEMQWRYLTRSNLDWTPFVVAMKAAGATQVVFALPDSSIVIDGIEYGLHGDRGTNGSRGTARNLSRLGRKVTHGDKHSAQIYHGVYVAGTCALRPDYMRGPSSHSVSHVIAYSNGKRAIITDFDGVWR